MFRYQSQLDYSAFYNYESFVLLLNLAQKYGSASGVRNMEAPTVENLT